jgi:uncharacterized protein YqjF (DUF2071 family)
MVGADNDGRPKWLLSQRWENLLFAHWPVEPRAVKRLLPPEVEPEVRAGAAWLAIVAFVMVGTRLYGAAPRFALAPIPELNVRAYVRVGGVPAVWFLSLDATSPFFAAMGKALYGLRYRVSRILAVQDGDAIHYLSTHADAAFAAAYAPAGPPSRAEPGTLEHFLVERYRLFAERRGRLITAEVTHAPWPLQPVDARIALNRMAPPSLALGSGPLLHFVRSVDALISAPVPVASGGRAPFSRSRISVPPPSARSAVTTPPWASATWRTMASPNPEPGMPRADVAR